MPPTVSPDATPRRARGRPRSLAPEAVLDAALALFEEEPEAEFTLARLARRLAVPLTSLYTYFPNRDALLDAAAERVFARFDWRERRNQPVDAALLSWMHAVERHFARYPIAEKLLAWDRHISPAWLRVLAPIITLLHREGLRAERLVNTFNWLINGTIGLIDAHNYTVRHVATPAAPAIDVAGADPAALAAQLEFWSHVATLDQARALDEGFRVLVAGVMRELGK